MKNTIKLLAIIAFAAVIGFSFTACGDGSGGGGGGGGDDDNGGGAVDSNWKWTAITRPDISISAIAYGNGRWVAVGGQGKIAYSTDNGVTWTAANSTFGTSSTIYGIAYNNGWFVAGGQGGRGIAYSTDGASWTAIANNLSLGGGFIPQDIAYGNGRFVAMGTDGGKFAYSADNGATWKAVSDRTPWQIGEVMGLARYASANAIAYGNGKFVAVGRYGKIVYSADNGESWTAVSNSTFGSDSSQSEIFDIAYGNGKFVAVGYSGKIAYSSDGASWTAGTPPTTTVTLNGKTYTNVGLDSRVIAYGSGNAGGRFVIGGRTGKLAYSADGINWTVVADNTFVGTYIDAMAYGNGRFIVKSTNAGGKMVYADWGEPDSGGIIIIGPKPPIAGGN